MEVTVLYVLSQIFIIFNYIFLMVTYQLKNRRPIILFNMCALVTAGLSYICLSAYTGLAMVFIAMLRNILFLINEKYNGISKKINKNDIYMLIVIYILTIIFTIFTYDGILSLMSVIATMLYTYSIWQKDTKRYKYLGIPISIIWIIYNSSIKSVFGVILEFILMIAEIVGVIRDKN